MEISKMMGDGNAKALRLLWLIAALALVLALALVGKSCVSDGGSWSMRLEEMHAVKAADGSDAWRLSMVNADGELVQEIVKAGDVTISASSDSVSSTASKSEGHVSIEMPAEFISAVESRQSVDL